MIRAVISLLGSMDRQLLALLGLAVGVLVATIYFLIRSQMDQRRGRRIVAVAQAEAERLRADGVREADASR
ncbi:MAG TPA: hypothetical protein VK688_05745, partial [Gemmatimonadales bacterium]|nr:hypothetical protein [Gemmatimonadales bacterium]